MMTYSKTLFMNYLSLAEQSHSTSQDDVATYLYQKSQNKLPITHAVIGQLPCLYQATQTRLWHYSATWRHNLFLARMGISDWFTN